MGNEQTSARSSAAAVLPHSCILEGRGGAQRAVAPLPWRRRLSFCLRVLRVQASSPPAEAHGPVLPGQRWGEAVTPSRGRVQVSHCSPFSRVLPEASVPKLGCPDQMTAGRPLAPHCPLFLQAAVACPMGVPPPCCAGGPLPHASLLCHSAGPRTAGSEERWREWSELSWCLVAHTPSPSPREETRSILGKNFPVCTLSFSLGLPSRWDYSSEMGAFGTGASP